MNRAITPDSLMPYIGTALLIIAGSFFFPQILTFDYLTQQLQIAAFLGLLATGATIVILLGHIDLSVPWVLTGAAILSTALVGSGDPLLTALAVPAALAFGALIGIVNGIGVAVLRIPSMVWTLAINSILLGLAVLNTGGFNPKGEASPLMVSMASGRVLGLPMSFLIWMAVCAVITLFLTRTPFGRYLRSIGYNEKATFLSGVSTPSVVFAAFALAGMCSAMGGVLLAGYANQAYQSMGDPFLLPTIAAVVIGGTSILGGRGGLFGTVGGALFITLLTSILSVMQIGDAWKSIVFGVIILAMLLFQTMRKGAHA
ncbi:ribose transport system permease protein [Labrenzia sp. EL_208]|uniref:Ribose transport system permease protein RbsC n=1 Tax=Roseibium album TaxID=311410 RepID=A0A0M7AF90_9HYPH|nr:ABC transporter permease [Roseibium album]MBG6172841.1 ribose transport system permease protein [Labrenzia sp. EL_132]MBG6226940.1 ribose transport system permease protein [Labrenzia sp. EL_208]MCR9056900.1 ABC transporter permease [Paracoccaceae bacterium]CTQ58997.1 Ribose transport system permease protein RbsC [Roseibium album]CTQ63902.1 Ribose transport system permease protein RbsC [Roseibium album]